MSDYKVSRRYATSLLESAIEKNMLDSIARDIELVASTLDANRQLIHALSNPVIRPNIKLKVLEEIFRTRVNPDTMSFLEFLVGKNRENLLDSISKIFLELRDQQLGIVNVEVTSAVAFSDEQVEMLRNNLERFLNKKARLSFKINKEIIGGFVARVGDTVFDASLTHQLELLKTQFLKGGASLN